MGYSCTQAAQDTLAVIANRFATEGNPNIWTMGTVEKKQYFFERGRENVDGAITGQLMLMQLTAEWPYAGCRPEDELAPFILKGLGR